MSAPAMSIRTRDIRRREERQQVYRITVLVRGEDGWTHDWQFVDEHTTHSRALEALYEFFHEYDDELVAGLYRAESQDGYSAQASYPLEPGSPALARLDPQLAAQSGGPIPEEE